MPSRARDAVRHPLFARFFTLLSRHEPRDVTAYRRQTLAGLTGRVVELGAGAGANFQHYPPTVTEVVAVEPEPYLRARAQDAAARASAPITVVDGTADELGLPDASFDAAVACLVLCSVPDQASALAELRRVLRAGGELRFFEHVLSRDPRIAAAQRFVDRTFWPRALGGCHTARDTPAAIAAAGFTIEREERTWIGPRFACPAARHAAGVARRP
jgi:ubiquinone/menaquinone biosynthesis C-methylase UbiE